MKKSIVAVALIGAVLVAQVANAQEKSKQAKAPAKTEMAGKEAKATAEPAKTKATANKPENGGKPAKKHKAEAASPKK